jgi:hypothetical protein
MNPTVTINAVANGNPLTITLAKTGPATGHITIAPTGGSAQDYDLKNIQADAATLKLVCQVDALLSADITLVVQPGTSGGLPVATIVISHAIFGNGTYVYTLHAGDDQQVNDFLVKAAFPPIGDQTILVAGGP